MLHKLRALRRIWIRQLIKLDLAGLNTNAPPDERRAQLLALKARAITVQDGRYAADYVAKFGLEPATESGGRWGPASEVTRGHVKKGKEIGGRTPFELLRLATDGDKRARMLFRDYAVSFKGERQLYWSRDLRTSLIELCDVMYLHSYKIGIDAARVWKQRAELLRGEFADEQAAARADERCTEFVVRIDLADWKKVIATNTRWALLSAAASHGPLGVEAVLELVRGMRATHSGEIFNDLAYLRELRAA